MSPIEEVWIDDAVTCHLPILPLMNSNSDETNMMCHRKKWGFHLMGKTILKLESFFSIKTTLQIGKIVCYVLITHWVILSVPISTGPYSEFWNNLWVHSHKNFWNGPQLKDQNAFIMGTTVFSSKTDIQGYQGVGIWEGFTFLMLMISMKPSCKMKVMVLLVRGWHE